MTPAELVLAAGPSEESGPASGVALGRYVLYGEIASGGMATVHYGRLTGRGGFRREVAIKRLHRHLAADPEFVAMFLDEARLAARVVHPHVVPMLDVVSRGDETFLVMDYVPGVALSQLVRLAAARAERVPLGVALAIAIGTLRGLHAAHEATDDAGARLEIVHRDVSPQNVLIGQDGVARLIDFGVAKAAVRLQTTREGHVKGKTAYMAPEQVIGAPVTRRTDIYAATVVLWEMLTGQRLYAGETDANILFRVATAEPRPPRDVVPELPEALDAIVVRGMARDAAGRYETAQEMADDLARLGGAASPEDIAAWVARVAGELLEGRARRIAALERAATLPDIEPPHSGSGQRAISVPPPPEAASQRITRPAIGSVTEADDATPAYAVDRRSVGARRRRGAALVLAVVTVAGVALAAGWTLRGRAAHPVASPEPPAAAPLPAAAVPPAPEVAPAPVASAAPPPPPPSAVASSEPSPRRDDPPHAGAAPRPARHPRLPGRPASPDCPPYTVDAKGHTHFNPACL